MATSTREPKPRVTTAPPAIKEEVGARPSRQQRRNWAIPLVALVVTVGIIGLIIALVVVVAGRSGDNVSAPSAPAVAAAPSPELVEGPAPVTAPVAPVAPVAASAPVAPIAAEQKPAANVAQLSTSKGFAPGKYTFKQINEASPNVVVAAIATIIDRGRFQGVALPDNYWLIVGSLRDPRDTIGTLIDPKDAQTNDYQAMTILAFLCPDKSCVGFWMVDFILYKTPSGAWVAKSFSTNSGRVWDRAAFETELSWAGNEPSRFRY